MDIVAIVALGCTVEEEAPRLAADLGNTAYEAAVMLRAPMPVVVHRGEDRARTLDLLGKLRARGHDAVACDASHVHASADMFRPKTFRFEDATLVAVGNGEERRLPFTDVFAFVRAMHVVTNEETVTTVEKKVSLGRAAMTGGLMMSKKTERDVKKVSTDREPVLYVFRNESTPWLMNSQAMLYDGLGRDMKVSKIENFEVLVRVLRERAPQAAFDARLMQSRPATQIVSAGAKQTTASSAGTVDVLAHIVAMSLDRNARPYR